jgi:hypothetical protein
VTALQDWLNIRPFDPRDHVKAIISGLRGVSQDDTETDTLDVIAEPALIRPGLERC